MAEILCGYTADRDERLVGYLYGEIDPAQRITFEAHIATCDRCRNELAELQAVRLQLREWTAPDAGDPSGIAPAVAHVRHHRSGVAWAALRQVPRWAQVAAALLFLGISARVANLDVQYDRDGLRVRTGLSRLSGGTSGVVAAPVQTPPASTTAMPWRLDLDALERRLRTELRAAPAEAAPVKVRNAEDASDAELLRKVRTLVEESERRQKNELALRLGEIVQEFDAKRGADRAAIRALRAIQNGNGIDVMRHEQWLDMLTQVSMQK